MVTNIDIYEQFPAHQDAKNIELRLAVLKLNDEGKLNDETWELIKLLSRYAVDIVQEYDEKVYDLERDIVNAEEASEFDLEDLKEENMSLNKTIRRMEIEIQTLKSQILQ